METILIIEDDSTMLRGLKDNFEYEGYTVITAADGQVGLDAALSAGADLIILDIMLPRINGYEICRYLRKQKLDTPIIMLTAKGQESDIVLGLNLGADDYVTKPFSIKELLARSQAFLRRNRQQQPTQFEFGDCRLDIDACVFTRAGKKVKLSPREFNLLHLFCSRPDRAFTRDDILNRIWGFDSVITSRTVDRFINTLRNKIEPDPRNPTYIETVREVGYKFNSSPSECDDL